MIRTAVVGGLHAVAADWLRAEADVRELDRRMSDLKREREAAYSRQCDAATRLSERVGSNIAMRALSQFGG